MDAGESEWRFDKPEAEPTDITEAHATAEPTEQAEAHEPAAAEPAAPAAAADAGAVGPADARDSDADDEAVETPASEEWQPGPNRDLKKEAKSLQHLLTHYPKNPRCDACTRARMRQRARTRRWSWLG